jgi:poly(hydroxyalkanoate) depolymerase family esterase
LWTKSFQRTLGAITRANVRVGKHAFKQAMRPAIEHRRAPPGAGEWIAGVAMASTGARRYHLYRPPGVESSERLPLLVMLHGCGQNSKTFAVSTRMNRIAARERFFVLYPEQDRRANPQGCWNWYDTGSGRAYQEASTLTVAIDQVCLFYPIDPESIAVAGLSAGASMAALLVTRYPERFKAIVMHSGIAPGTAHSSATAFGAMSGRRTPAALPAPRAAASWPPLMVIHGGADDVVSVNNGQAAVQVWAEAAGARAREGRRVRRGQRYEMTITDFKLKGSTVATYCEIDTLGHAWSGGAAREPYSDAQGPDASRMVWAFAARQFRAPR